MRDTWSGFGKPKFKYVCDNRECGVYYLCEKCREVPENKAILQPKLAEKENANG